MFACKGLQSALCVDNDLGPLQEVLHDVRSKWYDIGIQLKVSIGTLDTIKANAGDDKECLREMLKEWLKRLSPLPTNNSLITALQSRTVGENRLAKDFGERCSEEGGWGSQSPRDSFISVPSISTDTESSQAPRSLALVPYVTREREVFCNPEVDKIVNEKDGKFRRLVLKVYRYLAKRVDLNELKMIISLLPASWKIKNIRWTRDDLRTVMEAHTLHEVFAMLNQYWDWLHYELLECIVNEYGDASLKKEMKEYCQDLETVASRISLHDTKGYVFSSPHSDSVAIEAEIKGDPSQYALSKAQNFRQCLAREYSLEAHTLYLSRVGPGSTILTYQVPLVVSAHMIIESESKEQFFRDQEIIKLTISDKCVYSVQEDTRNQLSPEFELLNDSNEDVFYQRPLSELLPEDCHLIEDFQKDSAMLDSRRASSISSGSVSGEDLESSFQSTDTKIILQSLSSTEDVKPDTEETKGIQRGIQKRLLNFRTMTTFSDDIEEIDVPN